MTRDVKRFHELLDHLTPMRRSGSPDTEITSVCYDSRQALPGSLFVALRGGYADGHRFLNDARSRGAVAALVESWTPEAEQFAASAQVTDTRAALAQVAAR